MKGKLIGVVIALIGVAWVYTNFLQGAVQGGELRGMLPEWAGGTGSVSPVEEAVRTYADAHDYKGTSGYDYRDQIARVTTREWRESPAGLQMEETKKWLNENEAEWVYSVDLVSWRVNRETDKEALGVARYEIKSTVDGEENFAGLVENEVRLVPDGSGWAPAWASTSHTVEDRTGKGSADRAEETSVKTTRESAQTSPRTDKGETTSTMPEASPGPSVAEQQRDEAGLVEEAVASFNDAFDYEGFSADEYVAQIEPYVTDEYWSSPRGVDNLANIEEIEASGETFVQEAELVAWEPIQVGTDEATGYATRSFRSSVGSEPGSYELRHELRLSKEEGAWMVSYGGDPIGGEEGS